jgi:hypothetical protein
MASLQWLPQLAMKASSEIQNRNSEFLPIVKDELV